MKLPLTCDTVFLYKESNISTYFSKSLNKLATPELLDKVKVSLLLLLCCKFYCVEK